MVNANYYNRMLNNWFGKMYQMEQYIVQWKGDREGESFYITE